MSAEDDDGYEDNGDDFFRYKQNEIARGREPMTWGEWCRSGMPTPIEDDK